MVDGSGLLKDAVFSNRCSMGHFHWWSWLAFSLFCRSALCAQEWILDYQEIKIFFLINTIPPIPPLPAKAFSRSSCVTGTLHHQLPVGSVCTRVLKLLAIHLPGLLRTQLYRLKSDVHTINYTKLLAVYFYYVGATPVISYSRRIIYS